jgi:rhodanese-related sulfurtransferase
VAPPQGAFAELNAEQAYAAWRGGVLFLDARLGTDYAYGHIPGALSLSLRDPGFAQRLKALLAGAKGKPTQPVVVYCSGCCSTDSLFLAQSLKESGFTSIRNYRDGFPGWARAGYPRAVGEQPNALEVR